MSENHDGTAETFLLCDGTKKIEASQMAISKKITSAYGGNKILGFEIQTDRRCCTKRST